MSFSIQDTIQAIRDMIPIIDPEEDYLAIAAAEEQMAATEDDRRREMEDLNAKYQAAKRALEAARISSTRPSTIPSAEEHAALLNQLDATGLSLAKAINDAESALASKEAELARLKEELRTLEASDSAAEHDLDGTALRLAFYRGLGFEPVMGKDGRIAKMIVRSPDSVDGHVVTFDDGKSDKEYADLLWKLASS